MLSSRNRASSRLAVRVDAVAGLEVRDAEEDVGLDQVGAAGQARVGVEEVGQHRDGFLVAAEAHGLSSLGELLGGRSMAGSDPRAHDHQQREHDQRKLHVTTLVSLYCTCTTCSSVVCSLKNVITTVLCPRLPVKKMG